MTGIGEMRELYADTDWARIWNSNGGIVIPARQRTVPEYDAWMSPLSRK